MGYENSEEYRLEYRIGLCCFSWQPIVGVDPKRSDPKTLDSCYSAMRTYNATQSLAGRCDSTQSRLRLSSDAEHSYAFGPESSPRPAARMSKLIKATTIVMHSRATARLIFTAMTAVAEYSAIMSASSAQASLSFSIWDVLGTRLVFG